MSHINQRFRYKSAGSGAGGWMGELMVIGRDMFLYLFAPFVTNSFTTASWPIPDAHMSAVLSY
jgi:hypothetical protein